MKSKLKNFIPKSKKTLTKYLWSGLISSLILTLMSYFIVSQSLLAWEPAMYALGTLAVIQTAIQLVLFLHLGDEPSPYWNLFTFLFMLSILVIVVAGTIWIMASIDYNLMLK
jgi:cytochrome o ubiquinol oxidase subunit IV